MALNKSSNNTISKASVIVLIILASQAMLSHATTLKMHRRYLSSHAAAATTKGMVQGTVNPTEGEGFAGTTEGIRPSNPGHSPGIGHAFTNNKIGRKLLLTVDQA
ncbi:hypothetical protein ABZP36_019682 [Zizania latifolia]